MIYPYRLIMGKMVLPIFLVVNLLENFQNILMNILACFQMSDDCPFGLLFD